MNNKYVRLDEVRHAVLHNEGQAVIAAIDDLRTFEQSDIVRKAWSDAQNSITSLLALLNDLSGRQSPFPDSVTIGQAIESIESCLNIADNEEKIDIYPLTIVRDRYNGLFSGGEYTAWNEEAEKISPAVYGDDVDCSHFWWHNAEDRKLIGRGKTPASAVRDLARRLKEAQA